MWFLNKDTSDFQLRLFTLANGRYFSIKKSSNVMQFRWSCFSCNGSWPKATILANTNALVLASAIVTTPNLPIGILRWPCWHEYRYVKKPPLGRNSYWRPRVRRSVKLTFFLLSGNNKAPSVFEVKVNFIFSFLRQVHKITLILFLCLINSRRAAAQHMS